MMSKIKIGGAALNQTPLDWQSNLKNILDAIEAAKKEGIEILCLPELCITGYGCEDLFLSEWLPEKALTFLPEIIESTEGDYDLYRPAYQNRREIIQLCLYDSGPGNTRIYCQTAFGQ